MATSTVRLERSSVRETIFCGIELPEQSPLERGFAERVIARAADLIAERLAEEWYPQIIAKLDQQALANLALGKAAGRAAEKITGELASAIEDGFRRGLAAARPERGPGGWCP